VVEPPEETISMLQEPLELKLLVWSVGLTIVQMVIAVAGALTQVSLIDLVGNREGLPPLKGWVGRARRAHYNMLENLVLFAVLVVAASVVQKINAMTALGAELFFWGRLVYAAIYILGVPWIRTAAFTVSMAGLILIFLQLL
jgi:uncharacterized MAPEG superfamily protein